MSELPVGKIATDLIGQIEAAMKKSQTEALHLEGAIEGVKLLVTKLQEYVVPAGQPGNSTESARAETTEAPAADVRPING